MENQNERSLLRRAELMGKYRHIITKAAREKELERELERERERGLERELELERISKANRAAADREQNLLLSNENERAMKKRLAIKQQVRFKKEAQRASLGAVNATKKKDEVEDAKTSNFPLLMAAISALYGSRSIFEDGTGLEYVGSGSETEARMRSGN